MMRYEVSRVIESLMRVPAAPELSESLSKFLLARDMNPAKMELFRWYGWMLVQ